MPFISICIPAYKNPDFLRRLLQSIYIQNYKDFEVIITDDTPDDSLKDIINEFQESLKLNYLKNDVALGTPANWNFAIAQARGEWIKIMHNDDWFFDENSLQSFAAAANDNNHDFIFSAFNEVTENGQKKKYIINNAEKILLKKSPLNLFRKNFIGHPSTTLIRNNRQTWYDKEIKWVVDFEFYIRCLQQTNFVCIEQPLINIGIHSAQVTKSAFRNPEIEIPENLYLINKLGENSLNNIFVFDYYWRLFRNLAIRNFEQINACSKGNKLPFALNKMLTFQFKIPLSILKKGILSKSLMFLSKLMST